jgi:hypothetical protein
MKSKQILLSVPILILPILVLIFLRSPDERPGTALQQNKGDAVPLLPTKASHDQARPAPQAPAVAAASTEEMKALLDRMNELQREVADLKRKEDPHAVTDPDDAMLSSEEQRQREWESTTRATAFLDANFTRQPKDPSWSMNAEQQVSATFQSGEAADGSRLQQLACQSTLCRIHSRHDDPDAERQFMSRLGRLEAFGDAEAFSQRQEQPDGSVDIVTYVTRSGHRLPAME